MKHCFGLATIFIVFQLIAGCTSNTPPKPLVSFQPYPSTTAFPQNIDQAIIIVDSSSSMNEPYFGKGFPGQPGHNKFSAERELLNRFFKTVAKYEINAAVRSFGFGPCLSWGLTHQNHAMANSETIPPAIDTLRCASGGSPLGKALEKSNENIPENESNFAVIVFSDGKNLGFNPGSALKELKQKWNSKLCFYGVWVGNADETAGLLKLQEMSDLVGCGFTTSAYKIASGKKMTPFVERIFFDTSPQLGYSNLDNRFNDDDTDGVLNGLDQCPATPRGAIVDYQGCWDIVPVLFDFDKSNIKPAFHPSMDEQVLVLLNNPTVKIEVRGHTDSIGSKIYNQELSKRRANAVLQYFTSKGVEQQNLYPLGFWFSEPADTNDTKEGRANNRRVKIKIFK